MQTELIKNGKRIDGRKLDELRPLSGELNPNKSCAGSAIFRIGNTVAVANVFGPMEVYPRFLEDSEKAVIEVNYNMLPFSTDDRGKPGYSRRSVEISALIKRALENVICLEDMPKTKITINIDIVSADASTRCAALNAASMALAMAGIPMRDLVASCSAGKVEGELILDVAGEEDCFGEVDFPMIYCPLTKEVLFIQLDGILKKEEFDKLIEYAKKGCIEIYDFQKKKLMEFKSTLEK